MDSVASGPDKARAVSSATEAISSAVEGSSTNLAPSMSKTPRVVLSWVASTGSGPDWYRTSPTASRGRSGFSALGRGGASARWRTVRS